jgi:hypothetical protein
MMKPTSSEWTGLKEKRESEDMRPSRANRVHYTTFQNLRLIVNLRSVRRHHFPRAAF